LFYNGESAQLNSRKAEARKTIVARWVREKDPMASLQHAYPDEYSAPNFTDIRTFSRC
jgi:hypothetical protein